METEIKKLNCDSCGAGLKDDEQYCEYCGVLNKNYKEKPVKELKPNIEKDAKFGSFLGGVILSKAVKEIIKDIKDNL